MSAEVPNIVADSDNSSNPLKNSLNKSTQSLSPSKNSIESKVVLLGDTGKLQRIFRRHLLKLIEFFSKSCFELCDHYSYLYINRCWKNINCNAICRKSIQFAH